MQNKDSIVIYHIFRKDGTSLILHPFSEEDKTTDLLESAGIEGKYGEEPRVESLVMLRNELYRVIERQVKRWIFDQRFIPRFLISAGVFLAGYLFLSLVIRDPLPMIDEIAISLGASILCFILLGRRYLKSEPALNKRVQLRAKVDAIEFTPSDFVKAVEKVLQNNESATREEIVETLVSPIKQPLSEDELKDAKRIATYLKKRFSRRELKKQERMLDRRETSTDLLPSYSKLDFSLFAIYSRIKQSEEVTGKK